MADYPVLLQLKGRRCVVIGAGPVGQRKLQSLLSTGAELIIIAPGADKLNLPPEITIINRIFHDADLDDAALVFAATDSSLTNKQISAAAHKRKIPVNIADAPEASDFTLPAVLRQDELTVAVGTAGQSPAAAALIRDSLEGYLGTGWGAFIQVAAKLRQLKLTTGSKSLYNQQVLQILMDKGLIQMLEAGDSAGVEQLLATEFTGEVTLADLDISLPKGTS
jgi:precorrin-2 dehydrogenase/sirohydrochlorin ferrochelatase